MVPRQVHDIMENLHVIFLPCANPDGRAFVLSGGQPNNPTDRDRIRWRKNRNRNNQNDPKCFGVDLNRNFNFLFDFKNEVLFGDVDVSTDICDETYQGPYIFSEPEAKNIVWLLEEHNLNWLIDIHGARPDGNIFYPWGDDEVQTQYPGMNFNNPAGNIIRGQLGDTAYREYMPPEDLDEYMRLSEALSTGMRVTIDHDDLFLQYNISNIAARNRVGHSSVVGLKTTGTIQDYAYSRHFADGAKNKVFSFTIEHREFPNEDNWAPIDEDNVVQLIWEISHGLLRFCTANLP